MTRAQRLARFIPLLLLIANLVPLTITGFVACREGHVLATEPVPSARG